MSVRLLIFSFTFYQLTFFTYLHASLRILKSECAQVFVYRR